jgi:hypothetical protein
MVVNRNNDEFLALKLTVRFEEIPGADLAAIAIPSQVCVETVRILASQ